MYTLRINGTERVVDAPGQTSLLEVLRDDLALTGAKYGCGEARCGACVVLIDGVATPACSVPLADVGTREVVSIEGLAATAVQDAFVAEGAMQCGYCTPGLVVAAAALLARSPDPSDGESREALANHLSRSGGSERVVRAVRRAAGGGR